MPETLTRRFEKGDQVEVLWEPAKIWKRAVVFTRWAEIAVGSGWKPRYSYDVEGTDEQGFWHGRFTEDHVRAVVNA